MMNESTRIFIDRYQNEDVHTLSLLSDKYPQVDMSLAIRQITGKQKTKHKIPTYFACDNLLYPVKLSLEQSSSEITAIHKSARIEGKTLIDMTGGFGVDSFFFSSKFDKVIYVERQKELCELARHNFDVLNRKNIEVINDSAEKILDETDKVNWIYLDPARRTETGKKVVLLSDCEPNVAELAEKLLIKGDNIMIKLSPMIDLVSLTKELPNIAEIQVISVENECKEVVVILSIKAESKIQIKTTNYPNTKSVENFDFNLNDEPTAKVNFTNNPQTYLYEPNASIMKSGAFKSISEHFKIDKLHINSHLYTSEALLAHFPGRIFKVEKTYDFSKSSMKEFHSETQKANLSIRNFPMTVNELRKKLKLSEGGDVFVFATTLIDGKKVLISCKKI